MTFLKSWVLAGIAFAIGCTPALAADWGSVKDMGGVPIPVPAPAPVPTYDADSDWYVGLAIGAVVLDQANIDSYVTDSAGGVTPGLGARDGSDIGASPIFGLSFGRYLTPQLRAEIAIDYNRGSTIAETEQSDLATGYRSGLSTYQLPVTNAPTFDTSEYSISRSDTVKLSRTTALFNVIFDIPTGTRFTPYIGGGAGFTWRQMKRSYTETAKCVQTTNPDLPVPYPTDYCVNTAALPSSYSTSGSVTKDQFDFAAAVQAGIAYDITDSITWDNGWQMLWESNSIATTVPTVAGESTIAYKDSVLHQFRSGIRIKFN
ncbi:hypothetical protein DLM45_12735 [Hyphomicrobium methylovorum]|uniref:hypothetical protein n=1 Tax=Hyphomicrobium methylovorum TaxID=84 RepID=UPI0015E70BA9|nr:hypothetical protein [Hyphomicrobium methylovorum]MBA2127079.1 hypothetical protein [Hyphomicrobium methylovorum]